MDLKIVSILVQDTHQAVQPVQPLQGQDAGDGGGTPGLGAPPGQAGRGVGLSAAEGQVGHDVAELFLEVLLDHRLPGLPLLGSLLDGWVGV